MISLICCSAVLLCLVLLFFPAVSADVRYRKSARNPLQKKTLLPKSAVDSLQSVVWEQRNLQQQGNETNETDPAAACSLCGNYTLFPDLIPPYPPEVGELPEDTTCLDFALAASSLGSQNSDECYGIRWAFLNTCCQTPSRVQCETDLRSDLLANYDPAVPPAEEISGLTHVNLVLEFFHISELDIKDGTVEVFVWIYLSWDDPRLAWKGTDHDCARFTTFRASLNKELEEIWVPDFDLFNQVEGVQKWPEAQAEVTPDGKVLWRRNGGLRAFCQFSGLRRIPFDTLGCQYIVGGWTRQGIVQYHFGSLEGETNGTGFAFGEFDTKYNEYRLIPAKTETGHLFGSKSIMYYNFYFERSRRFYIVSITIPAILFTFLSFGMFLLDLRVGERLSYGMALLLVMVAHSIVTTDFLPVTETRLWIVMFINASFYWVVFGLVESILVGYLFFAGDDDIQNDIRNDGARTNDRLGSLGSIPERIVEDEDETNGSDQEAPPSSVRRGRSLHKSFNSVKSVFTLRQSMINHRHQRNHNRKLIRKIDKWCFRLVPASYILFLIIFFACLPLWEESGDDIWSNEENSKTEEL